MATRTDPGDPILAAAVADIGGDPRPGQIQMAAEVAETLATGEHLLVQAGTGTGKSLAYLAPVLGVLAEDPDQRVVIATATLALQSQLAGKDIPTAVAACQRVTGVQISHAVVKGRSNYACLYKVRAGVIAEPDALLPDPSTETALGSQVVALREWAEEQATSSGLADRDDAPSHTPLAWAQVSVPVRECLGAAKCPFGAECFVERSRELARASQLVVTNHAMLAVDAMHGGTALPEHEAVIIDEAHELVSRITGAASAELSPQLVERVAKRCLPWLSDQTGVDFLNSVDELALGLDNVPVGRVLDEAGEMVAALQLVRDSARRAVSELAEDELDPDRHQALGAAQEVFDVAQRMAALAESDVVWVAERERFGRQAHCAPLSVAHLLRDRIFNQRPVVLTSATLRIGGDFQAVAESLGLGGDEPLDWRGVDVGSPFDYRNQAMLYVAAHLPGPSREGISNEVLAEVAELVWAAGGRTLGLFAAQRSAEAAARFCREHLPDRLVLCQGEAHLAELTEQFVAEPAASLFGTLSLWQGIDVPGETCQLVLIDKIPFPRPDDPLMQARQTAVAEAGGNGFMAIAATHAALLLAQGSGRLIRTLTDRGVVAVLDPRLVTARYGSFLRASMPDFWMTTDRETVVAALQRLDQSASNT